MGCAGSKRLRDDANFNRAVNQRRSTDWATQIKGSQIARTSECTYEAANLRRSALRSGGGSRGGRPTQDNSRSTLKSDYEGRLGSDLISGMGSGMASGIHSKNSSLRPSDIGDWNSSMASEKESKEMSPKPSPKKRSDQSATVSGESPNYDEAIVKFETIAQGEHSDWRTECFRQLAQEFMSTRHVFEPCNSLPEDIRREIMNLPRMSEAQLEVRLRELMESGEAAKSVLRGRSSEPTTIFGKRQLAKLILIEIGSKDCQSH